MSISNYTDHLASASELAVERRSQFIQRVAGAVMFGSAMMVPFFATQLPAYLILLCAFLVSGVAFNALQWDNVRRFCPHIIILLTLFFILAALAGKTYSEFTSSVPFYLALASLLIHTLPGLTGSSPYTYELRTWPAANNAGYYPIAAAMEPDDRPPLRDIFSRGRPLDVEPGYGHGYPNAPEQWLRDLDSDVARPTSGSRSSPLSSVFDISSQALVGGSEVLTATPARTSPMPPESIDLDLSGSGLLPSEMSSIVWSFFPDRFWIPRRTQRQTDMEILPIWHSRRENTYGSSVGATAATEPSNVTESDLA